MTTPANTIRRPADIDAARNWLAHGGELAVALKGDRACHSDVIWQLLVEAVEVIDKQPDQERHWLNSGKHSGGWNTTGMTRAELIEIERIRLLTAMKPYDGDTKYAPQRNDVDRALGVLEWMRWLNSAKSGDRLSKAAIELARSGDIDIVRAIYCPDRKSRGRQIAHDVRTRAIGFVLAGLRDDLGIVPAGGVSFNDGIEGRFPRL